jgi:hypothetical protein
MIKICECDTPFSTMLGGNPLGDRLDTSLASSNLQYLIQAGFTIAGRLSGPSLPRAEAFTRLTGGCLDAVLLSRAVLYSSNPAQVFRAAEYNRPGYASAAA